MASTKGSSCANAKASHRKACMRHGACTSREAALKGHWCDVDIHKNILLRCCAPEGHNQPNALYIPYSILLRGGERPVRTSFPAEQQRGQVCCKLLPACRMRNF